MRQVFRFDEDGNYIEPVILEDWEPTPSDCTEDKWDIGIIKPKRVEDKWVEGATDQEIAQINAIPSSNIDTTEKRISELETAVAAILGGVS